MAITVHVGVFPGTLSTVAVEENATVREVLKAADLDADGYTVKIGTDDAELNDDVQDGETVLLVTRVKGN